MDPLVLPAIISDDLAENNTFPHGSSESIVG
jgi:hypothetical protein